MKGEKRTFASLISAHFGFSLTALLGLVFVDTSLSAAKGSSQLKQGKEGEAAGKNSFFSTSGKVEVKSSNFPFSTKSEKMRMRSFEDNPRQLLFKFRYKGQTEKLASLGSGELRSQFGIFLNAENQCNALYIMWRISEGRLAVQQKSNPGKSTHQQCLNNGYKNLKPSFSAKLPRLVRDEEHLLQAKLESSDVLVVSLDGTQIWKGSVPTQRGGAGFIGVRSDNVNLDFNATGLKSGLTNEP